VLGTLRRNPAYRLSDLAPAGPLKTGGLRSLPRQALGSPSKDVGKLKEGERLGGLAGHTDENLLATALYDAPADRCRVCCHLASVTAPREVSQPCVDNHVLKVWYLQHMVEGAPSKSPSDCDKAGAPQAPSLTKVDPRRVAAPTHRGRVVAVSLAILAAAAIVLGIVGVSESTRSAASRAGTAKLVANPQHAQLAATSLARSAVATTTTAIPKSSAPPSAHNASVPKTTKSVPVVQTATTDALSDPAIATSVVEVEDAGIEPGSNWSWSMGDTEKRCGFIAGTGTGCTFAVHGVVETVFGGSPSLALVAHELGNAETLNDAIPSLMSKVSSAESGSSWSTTDAVASCLVAHFMGFQDGVAGTWRCPNGLSTFVAQNIHDVAPVTTQLTSTCGKTSKANSTLTFTASAGVLTVTGPAVGSVSETVMAGTPVTVSGIGTFSGVDQGGLVKAAGICAP
jgi:hypothetical protein